MPADTYAEIMIRLAAQNTKTAKNQLSSFRFLLRHTHWGLSSPADRRRVIEYFDGHTAAELGVSRASLSVHKSQVLAVLPKKLKGNRSTTSMGPLYGRIYGSCEYRVEGGLRSVLGTFLIYLEDNHISPDKVSSKVLDDYSDYRLALSTKSIKTHDKNLKFIARLWRKIAAREDLSDLNMGNLPDPSTLDPRKYHVDPALFHKLLAEFDESIAPWARGERSRNGETFEEAIARLDLMTSEVISDKKSAWNARRKHTGSNQTLAVKSEAWRLAAGFVNYRGQWGSVREKVARDQVLTCAKAFLSSGGYVIESFVEFCDPDIVAECCSIISQKNATEGHDSSYVNTILMLHWKIATQYLCMPEDAVGRLREIIMKYPKPALGIRPKNKAKLRLFTSEKISEFVNFSDTLINDANRDLRRERKNKENALGRKAETSEVINEVIARRIMQACAHDIMLARAPRISNFNAIKIDWLRKTGECTSITVPAVLVKKRRRGDADLDILLDKNQSERLWTYIHHIRPFVLLEGDHENRQLFPCTSKKVKETGRSYDNLLPGLCKAVSDRMGVQIHPHLYRHLIGWIWLKDDPTKLPHVQKMLGHKNLATTLASYAELDESGILTSWNEHLQKRRQK